MTTMTIKFYECEHSGDMGHYCDDIAAAGGRVTRTEIDSDAETGTAYVEVANEAAFRAAFANTDSADFSSL